MAIDVSQRDMRNHMARVLRRVEAGERLRITVHGHQELTQLAEPPRDPFA